MTSQFQAQVVQQVFLAQLGEKLAPFGFITRDQRFLRKHGDITDSVHINIGKYASYVSLLPNIGIRHDAVEVIATGWRTRLDRKYPAYWSPKAAKESATI